MPRVFQILFSVPVAFAILVFGLGSCSSSHQKATAQNEVQIFDARTNLLPLMNDVILVQTSPDSVSRAKALAHITRAIENNGLQHYRYLIVAQDSTHQVCISYPELNIVRTEISQN